MKYLISIFALLLMPSVIFASSDPYVTASDIRFSEETLYAGDTVRIYASIHNGGAEDVSGYVSFYQGATLLGDSQVISVIAGGSPEEVFVDFVVPSGPFNIMAQIKGTEPEDSNPNNNVAITGSLTPRFDDDRDGVENDDDNCPNTFNSTQDDTDGDGNGDECDDDDDNDGLSDAAEAELGTGRTDADSDGDGVSDADDAYPLDPTRSELEIEEVTEVETEEVEVVEEEPVIEVPEAIDTIVKEIAETLLSDTPERTSTIAIETLSEEEQEELVEVLAKSSLQLSPNAIFTYTRIDWNTYEFEVLGPEADASIYVWNFGDGTTSSKTSMTHTFKSAGAYNVTLSITNASGEVSSESTMVHIPFFSLNNWIVLLAVVLLGILLIAGLVSIIVLARKPQKKKRKKTS